MHHRLKPSCQNKNKKLTGSSEFTLKSLLHYRPSICPCRIRVENALKKARNTH